VGHRGTEGLQGKGEGQNVVGGFQKCFMWKKLGGKRENLENESFGIFHVVQNVFKTNEKFFDAIENCHQYK